MPGITFTEQDIKDSADMPAGWYKVAAKSITEQPGKNDPEATTFATIFGVQDGDFQGREVRNYFSTKMMKTAYKYLKCFGVTPKANEPIPIEETVGRVVEAYIVMDPESGFPNIKDFRPVKS